MRAFQHYILLMSASRRPVSAPDDSNDWLTIAAVIALVYALGVIGAGSIGTAINASHSIAHWVGRTGSLTVIIGVLLHQHAAAAAGIADDGRLTGRSWYARLAPWTIAAGLVAIVAGFASGVLGY